jgi:hypothetical protein
MGVSKKFKVHMQIGTCALLWARWNMGNNIIFNNACYQAGYLLDSHVNLPIINGEATQYGYWVQPARISGTNFI